MKKTLLSLSMAFAMVLAILGFVACGAVEYTISWTVPAAGVTSFLVKEDSNAITSGSKVNEGTELTISWVAANNYTVTVKVGSVNITNGGKYTVEDNTAFTITATAVTPEPEPTEPEPFIVDASVSVISGIEVSITEVGKLEFETIANNQDPAYKWNYNDRGYNLKGELDCVFISVTGTVSMADCEKFAIPMSHDGDRVDAAEAGYWTDFYNLSILIPEEATKIQALDGLPTRPVAELGDKLSEGYYTEEIQWLLNSGSSWIACARAGENDTEIGCFYLAFYDEAETLVCEYFIFITYDITFVA